MVKKIYFVLISLLIISTIIWCSLKTKESNSDIKLSNSDIYEAKKVLENHFEALENESFEEVNKSLGEYPKEKFDRNNQLNWKPAVVSISYPGRLTNDNMPPQSYVKKYGKDPYKVISFYVVYKIDGDKQMMDYKLIKENEEGPWLIHEWGQ